MKRLLLLLTLTASLGYSAPNGAIQPNPAQVRLELLKEADLYDRQADLHGRIGLPALSNYQRGQAHALRRAAAMLAPRYPVTLTIKR
jgi:hypothetical protein